MKNISLGSLFKTFLIIGSTSFGGYMALIAMIRKNLVERDNRISDDVLTEGLSLSSFLPGPIAVNVVAYVGYKLKGVTGALVSVFAALLPSFLLVCGFSVLYFNFGQAYFFNEILIGIVPAVIAIIISVAVSMTKKICIHWTHFLLATVAFVVLFLFSGYWSVVFVLIIAAIIGVLLEKKGKAQIKQQATVFSKGLIGLIFLLISIILIIEFVLPYNIISSLFAQFSRVSLTLFGGGYVMVPILKSILVEKLGWVTHNDFLFGISIGQVTPGPILISAAFFGYKMAGMSGAFIATLGIFLPSSLLMISVSETYQKVKNHSVLQGAMSGIKPAVVGMIFYSAVSLFIEHTKINNSWIALFILMTSYLTIFKFNIHTSLVIILSGVLGYFANYIL